MALTPEIEKDVLIHYRRTRSPFKVAQALGISVDEAWSVIDKHKDDNFEERHGGQGRPELVPFIVATRRTSVREWDNESPEIIEARKKFEAGTHTLCTGRDGPNLILYCIPRRRKQPRPGYFTLENS